MNATEYELYYIEQIKLLKKEVIDNYSDLYYLHWYYPDGMDKKFYGISIHTSMEDMSDYCHKTQRDGLEYDTWLNTYKIPRALHESIKNYCNKDTGVLYPNYKTIEEVLQRYMEYNNFIYKYPTFIERLSK